MPALSAPAKILVTGANGYVGCWLVHALLDRGYSVRGAVRTDEKAHTLTALMAKKHPAVVGTFDCIVVPNISAEGALDDCLGDIDGIIHTATPVTFALDDPEAYIRPALNGTMGVLRSAATKDIKRVIITSSIGAVAESVLVDCESRVYTEEDWNDHAVETVKRIGEKASGIVKYDASKVLAEQGESPVLHNCVTVWKSTTAAWKFYEDGIHTLPFDISVVAPGWILGPLPDEPASPADFTTPSSRLEWTQLFADPPPENPTPAIFNYVDIRDVTEMHMRALELPRAGGERFLSSSVVCTWQDWFNIAHELKLLSGLERLHPAAIEDKSKLPPHPIFSHEKAEQLLGITFKTVPETLRDLVEDFRGRGWLKHLE
ncbi:NAD-P-binding protein [Trametes gibbosa]|nr:NAD-P-binding protein [Trametes gibbosa]